MELGALFPWLLATHVLLAISLFMPSFLLPFTFRFRRHGYAESPESRPGSTVRTLLWLQGNGTVIIGSGVALTGLGLVAVLGTQLLSQPWLLVALSIYAANLAAAFFVQRPGVPDCCACHLAPTPPSRIAGVPLPAVSATSAT